MPQSVVNFQAEHQVKTKYVSVWLEESPNSHTEMFYCPRCRAPIAQIEGTLISLIPGRGEGHALVTSKCPNRACGRKYIFREILKQDVPW